MTVTQKVKTAPDETRMLTLGASILLGFQFRGAFAESFDRLPAASRYADALALGLMICVIGLLIAPGLYHRLAEGGEDSGTLHRVVTAFADTALLPFALALGLDIAVAAERLVGGMGAAGLGLVAAGLGLAVWYALPRWRSGYAGARERNETMRHRNERPGTPLRVKIEQMLTEARVVLPGVQALLGFQLAIVLTDGFEKLPDTARAVHGVSLGLIAISVILLMAPAAYHRIVFTGEDTPEMHRVGSIMVTTATVPLLLGLAGDVYVVVGKIAGEATGLGSAIAITVLLCALWYAFPLAARWRHAARGGRAEGERVPG